MNRFVVVIPARYDSVRIPGKPLVELDDNIRKKPMIQYVYDRAKDSNADEVWIATDDERIEAAAREFGANVCMTSGEHRSGTERIAEVCDLKKWPDELAVVNIQCDQPALPAVLIDESAALLEDDSAGIGTLAWTMESKEEFDDWTVVKIITDRHNNALYFSRAPIPYSRDDHTDDSIKKIALRHIGIYSYRCRILRQLIAAGPCDLEECEDLEQLRALWLGITVRIGHASKDPGPHVEKEEDIPVAEKALQAKTAGDD